MFTARYAQIRFIFKRLKNIPVASGYKRIASSDSMIDEWHGKDLESSDYSLI